METDEDINTIVEKKGIKTISDTTELTKVINHILDSNPESIQDYKDKKDKAVKYLMGQIMKETKGQASPALTNQLLITELNNR